MRHLRVLLLPQDVMLVYCRVTLSTMLLVPIYTPGWREKVWGKVSYLRKPHDGRDQVTTHRPSDLGPVSRNSRQLSGPGKYFSELIYLAANGNYWCKLSNILHEIIKIKILPSKINKSCITIGAYCAHVFGLGTLLGVLRNGSLKSNNCYPLYHWAPGFE